jgi:response regulator RpfG family c-di-GMP phosphodiesterase
MNGVADGGSGPEQARRVLILEDNPADAELIERSLRGDGLLYSPRTVGTERAFLDALAEHAPDIVLADYSLPGYDGLAALEAVRAFHPDVPVIIVSGILGEERAAETIKWGATDFVLKDRLFRLVPCVRRALQEVEERRLRLRAEERLRRSEERFRAQLAEKLSQLQQTLNSAVRTIELLAEVRDPYTAGHQRRVAHLACGIAREMDCDEDMVTGLQIMASIHDIGKTAVPSDILSKPGALNENEFAIVKTHPLVAYDILKELEFPWPVAAAVYQHHERLNGTGYPRGLTNGEIILEARLLAVADVVEAMASHRPYRPALGLDRALREISEKKGRLYDASVVDSCLRLFEEKGFTLEAAN